MARIPAAYSDLSSAPSLRSGRTIARYDTTAIGEGIQRAAAGLDNLGDSLSRVDQEKKQQETTVQAANAEADYTGSLLDRQNKFEADPDYENAVKTAGPDLDKALNKSAEGIKDPKVREKWIALKKESLVRAKDWFTDKATEKRQSANLVSMDEALEKSRRLYVDPATPEDVKNKARADIEGAIKMGETSGLLTPELAADKRFKFLEQADYSRGLMEVERDPSVVTKALPATVAERSSRAMEYYMSRGWTKQQAAGIVGNLIHESGGKLDPNALNPGDGSDGSDSIGVGQWNSTRATALKKFAALNKADWRDYGIQLAFVDHELRSSEKAAGDKLKAATTIQGANDAFIGYERPRGSDQGARNAHGYKSRLNYAAQAAGENVNPDWYKNISPEARDKIDSVAAAREQDIYQQKVAEAKVFQQQARDDFSLQIATNPMRVTQSEILANSNLDNGDKASLINTLNAAQKENAGVNEFIGALQSGQSISVNGFDADQKKIADKSFDKLMQVAPPEQRSQLTSSFISQTGYLPDSVRAEIRRGMETTDVAQMAQNLATVDQIERLAPVSLANMEGAAKVNKNLQAYRHYTLDMGYGTEEAARKVIALNDPEMAKQREAIMKSKPIADTLKAVDASSVSGIYDTAFSFAPSVGDAPTQQELSVGYTPDSEAVIVSDYRDMLEEGIADAGGDLELGKKMANERFQRFYGPSSLTMAGDRSIIHLPPEKTYPTDKAGSHDYLRSQALEDLKKEGITATDVFFQPFDQTEKDVASGKLPNYQIFYTEDGQVKKYQHPFVGDPARAEETAVKQSAVKQKENLGNALETQQRLKDAGQRKEGSEDWIKALEIQNESQRIDNERRLGIKPNDAAPLETPDSGEMPATDAMGNPI